MSAFQKSIEARYAKGIVLSGAIAALATWVSTLPTLQQSGLSALTVAILIGIILGNTLFPRMAQVCADGVDFSKNKLLRLGIILYGFRITFPQLVEIGWAGLVINAIIVVVVFTLAVQLGTRVLHLDRQTSMLIGAGSAICGAAAVMASAPVIRSPEHKASVAVATVVVFGTIAMFLYPLAYPFLGMTEAAYGRYVGSTVHEVAQVVTAGNAVGDQASSVAVVGKMLRVMMLAPFLMFLSSRSCANRISDRRSALASLPVFALLFIVTVGINSLQVLPDAVVKQIIALDNILLAMAMAALGLRTHVSAFRQAGLKAILLAALLFIFLAAGGYLINQGVGAFFEWMGY